MTEMTVWDPQQQQRVFNPNIYGNRQPEPAEVAREQRAPTAATQPLTYRGVGNTMIAEWGAEQALRYAYLANVFVYACARAIAQDISALPIRAGTNPDQRNTYNPNAPLAQFLGPTPGGPAPKLSARRLIAWSIVQRLITGRFAWEIETAPRSDTIVALWPLTAVHLEAVPTRGGSEWFSGFRFGQYTENRKNLPADRVFYSWNPSQADFRQPESALQAARLDVSVAVMQDRYDFAFLKNDARPASVVVTEAFATRGDFDAFKSQWRGEYGGVDNAGKTAFLESEGSGSEGVKNAILVQTLGLSQKDAEFMARYESKIRNICVALGVPMSRLMDASKRTFSNADRETANYWQTTILDLARDLEDDINMSLAPRLGSEVCWFDTSGVEALKPKPRYSGVEAKALIESGIASADELRPEFGLSGPAPTPLAVPIDDEPEPPALQLAAGSPEPEVRHPEELSPEELAVRAEQRRSRIWRAADAQANALEGAWERRWRTEFRRQERATIDRLTGRRGRQLRETNPDASAVFDRAFWTAEAEDMAAGLYDSVFAVGGARVSSIFGIAFDLDAEFAREFVRARANQLAGQVTDTTYGAIQDALASGIAAGEDVDQLAQRVRHVFDVASETRARVIARTEVVSAMNGSALAVAATLPADVAAGQEWIATRDDRVRDAHASADGQVVSIGVPFSVAGEALAYPGDPNGSASNTVQCRCTVAFLTPEEMAERAARSRVVRLADFDRVAARVATGETSPRLAHQELGLATITPIRAGVADRAREVGVVEALAVLLERLVEPRAVKKTVVRDERGDITEIIEESA